MPRQPKPFFRKQTQSWYFSTGGQQINLGKDKDAAFAKFHQMMADPATIATDNTTLYELSQTYLDWVQTNRKKATYDRSLHYLKSFIDKVGKQLKVTHLKPFHVNRWIDKPTWNSTSRADAIGVVQRNLNWAVEQGYLLRNPIAGMRKPKKKRRDVFYTHEQWQQIREHAKAPFDDLLDFLYCTGCRPIEARTIEARFILDDMVIFPTDQSKGETEPRVIYLVPKAAEILARLATKHPTGHVFRNSKDRSWTKDSIKCRLDRISKKVKFHVIAYGARHSWATHALTSGGIDSIAAAHLMGHKDPAMVAQVYSHLAKQPEFLRAQAAKAIQGHPTK
ncbi:phage-like integrase [Rhodopirellula islandica]|uniref:Phage-like integrase n=1 Tax=Rhodopirellula islandica TaxID=595434 RepID=A0A0J1BDC7_RHOIS|nr:tyrosine-type recombinase/integrase [Rhodopirellula islandica]KLU04617.1 phage-like integrase [Rhodopirellula islandica]